MSTAFSLQGTLVYPPDAGQPMATRAFSGSGSFDSKQEAELNIAGAGTLVVSFGTVLMAKALMLEADPTNPAVVMLKFNGGTDTVEVAPGGFLAYSNPVPTAGITALSIVTTTAAKVSLRLLG